MEKKEAMKILKDFHDKSALFSVRTALDTIIPELKESEDERMIKWLIETINFVLRDGRVFHDKVIDEAKEALAWLEKQREQKSNVNGFLNWSKEDEKMFQTLDGIVKDYWTKAEQENNKVKIIEASKVCYFLKTIQKSPLCWIKCSDGLPNKDGIYLVATDGRHNDVYDIARYDSIEGWHKASEIIYWMPIPQLNNKSILEQNPTWSEEDEAMYQGIIETEQYMLDVVYGRKNFSVGNESIKEECAKELAWLKSLKDRIK